MKKAVSSLILLVLLCLLCDCGATISKPIDGIKMYTLIGDHLYSEDIFFKVSYKDTNNGIEKEKCFESNLYMPLQGFLRILYNYEIVNEVSTQNTIAYIESNIEFDVVYIESRHNNSSLKVYINKSGKVLILKDNKLYETKENAVDYKKFATFEKTNYAIDSINFVENKANGLYTKYSSKYGYRGRMDNYYYDEKMLEMNYEDAIESGHTSEAYLKAYKIKIYSEYLYNLLDNEYDLLRCSYYTYGADEHRLDNNDFRGGDNYPYIDSYWLCFNQVKVDKSRAIFITKSGSFIYDYDEDWYYILPNGFVSYDEFASVFEYNNIYLNEMFNNFKSEHGIE
ncbi:MAG: hypothetical protein J6X93_06770 [Bacilli bacterium]|nr:hypothetical protein [Bacilli bacterium]